MEGRDPQTHLTLFSETYDLRPRPPSEPATFSAVAPAVLRPGRVEIVPQPVHVWQGAGERTPASTLVRQSSDAPDSARQARERISYETAQGVEHWRSNIYGVMTSDASEGWTSRSECTSAVGPADISRGAILIVATLGEEGVERAAGPAGAWGVVKGLMEHYAARGGQSLSVGSRSAAKLTASFWLCRLLRSLTGPEETPLCAPLVFLFTEDSVGLAQFLDRYQAERSPARPPIHATLHVDIPALTPEEHCGPLEILHCEMMSPLVSLSDCR